MAFLEEAKKAGYSEVEAKNFAKKITRARKAGYTNDEISTFLDEQGEPPVSKTPTISAPEIELPPSGGIRAPRTPAEMTSDLIRRGRLTEFGREAVEYGPEIAGATALLAAGGPATLPVSLGRVALGGAGGKGYQLAARGLTGAPGAPKTSLEAVADVTGAAVRQSAGELAGRAVIRSIGRVLRGGFFRPAAEAVGETVERRLATKEAMLSGKKEELLKARGAPPREIFEAFGGRYTAAQMTESRVLDTLDNMAQGSFFGGGVMDRTFLQQQKSVKEIGDFVADSFLQEGGQKLSDRQLGQLFVDTVQDGRSAFKTSAEKMFRNVDDLMYEQVQIGAQKVFPKEAAGARRQPTGILVERYAQQTTIPKSGSVFFSKRGAGTTDFGPKKKEYVIDNINYKILDSQGGSIDFIEKRGLLDSPLPKGYRERAARQVRKDWGETPKIQTYRDLVENGHISDIWAAPQNLAESILKKEGYSGVRWSNEAEAASDQFQIWDREAIKEGLILPTSKKPTPTEYGYVNTKPVAARGQELIEEYKRIRGIGKSEAGGTLLDKVAALPESMTFGDAQLLRSNLLEEARQISGKEGKGRALAIATELGRLTDNQMEKAAARLPPEVLPAWRDANKFYKFGKTNFDNEFVRKLVTSGKVNWEEVGDLIFRSGNVDEVHKVRNALRAAEFTSKKAKEPLTVAIKLDNKVYFGRYGETHPTMMERLVEELGIPEGQIISKGDMGFSKGGKYLTRIEASKIAGGVPGVSEFLYDQMEKPIDFMRTWRQMQSGYYESLIRKNTDPVTGTLRADGLLRDLGNRKTERTIKAAFNNDQLNAIRNFAKVAHLADPRTQRRTGVNMIQWAQGGAILAMANPFELVPEDFEGLVTKVGGGILISPYIIAKLLTNPMTTRWLIQGVKTPITSGASGGLGVRLGYAAIKAAQNEKLPADEEP